MEELMSKTVAVFFPPVHRSRRQRDASGGRVRDRNGIGFTSGSTGSRSLESLSPGET